MASQGRLEKYYPQVWRFFMEPLDLCLDLQISPELSLQQKVAWWSSLGEYRWKVLKL